VGNHHERPQGDWRDPERRLTGLKMADMKVVKTEMRKINGQECEVVTLEPDDQKQHRGHHIGCPWEFFEAAYRASSGKVALALAQMIYRRHKVRGSKTIMLDRQEVAALGMSRNVIHKALREEVGLIRLHPVVPGHKAVITLLWPR
jgi:hypothetical protein